MPILDFSQIILFSFLNILLLVRADRRPDKPTRTFEVTSEQEKLRDSDGFEAIKELHRLMDDDQSGSIDRNESSDFIAGDLKVGGVSDRDRREQAFHHGDERITIDDLWDSWFESDARAWDQNRVMEWLRYSVKLPQYVDNFSAAKVTGILLPRMALLNSSFISQELGIKNYVHRQRIQLKALDLVLFGHYDPTGSSLIKDVTLGLLCVLLVIVCVLFRVHRSRSRRQLGELSSALSRLRDMERDFEKTQRRYSKGSSESSDLITTTVVCRGELNNNDNKSITENAAAIPFLRQRHQQNLYFGQENGESFEYSYDGSNKTNQQKSVITASDDSDNRNENSHFHGSTTITTSAAMLAQQNREEDDGDEEQEYNIFVSNIGSSNANITHRLMKSFDEESGDFEFNSPQVDFFNNNAATNPQQIPFNNASIGFSSAYENCLSFALQPLLKRTYEIEMSYLNQQKMECLREMQDAREFVDRMRRKQTSLLNSLKLATGASSCTIDIDNRIFSLKAQMERIKVSMGDCRHRWADIEAICGFSFIGSFAPGSAPTTASGSGAATTTAMANAPAMCSATAVSNPSSQHKQPQQQKQKQLIHQQSKQSSTASLQQQLVSPSSSCVSAPRLSHHHQQQQHCQGQTSGLKNSAGVHPSMAKQLQWHQNPTIPSHLLSSNGNNIDHGTNSSSSSITPTLSLCSDLPNLGGGVSTGGAALPLPSQTQKTIPEAHPQKTTATKTAVPSTSTTNNRSYFNGSINSNPLRGSISGGSNGDNSGGKRASRLRRFLFSGRSNSTTTNAPVPTFGAPTKSNFTTPSANPTTVEMNPTASKKSSFLSSTFPQRLLSSAGFGSTSSINSDGSRKNSSSTDKKRTGSTPQTPTRPSL